MNLIIQTAEDLSRAAEDAERNTARAYLNMTDWMILRFAETGTPVPTEVLDKRAEARALLSNKA